MSAPDNRVPSGEPLLAVRGVTLQYKTEEHIVTATYRISFDVLRSDRFVILGPSGCGKSTLLKAIGGYLKPVEGTIREGASIISASLIIAITSVGASV